MSAGITAAGVTAAAAAATAGAGIAAGVKGGGGGSTKAGPQFGIRDTTNSVTNEQVTSTLNPETLAMLQKLVMGGDYSKGAAIKDSEAAVTAAIQEVMQKYMPTIAANSKGSGMMADSMTQILANQTAVQAAVQGGAVKMNAINSYSSSLDNFIKSLIAGSPQSTSGKQTNNTTERTAGSATSSTTNPGSVATLSGVGDTIAKLMAASKMGPGSTPDPTYVPITGSGEKSTYGAKAPNFNLLGG
jgi:hypothetical protein